VVGLDLPGHGASGRDREKWSVTGLGADVARVVVELEVGPVILIGHSMGGPVALAAAAELGEAALGVVLIDTVHDAETAMSAEMVEQIASAFESDYEGTMRRFVPAMFPEGADPGLPAWVLERALAADRGAAVALMRAFEDVDAKALLGAAGVPVRAVNAAPWPPMIPETAVETNRRYADFDAELIEGVGHYLLLEKPEAFNPALRRALGEIAEIAAASHE
jgi:pimeloyl-ACP methyl ester carboxylesterase